MKNLKFKARSIWRSSELKVITMVILFVFPLVIIHFFGDKEFRHTINPVVIISISSYLLLGIICLRVIDKDHKNRL